MKNFSWFVAVSTLALAISVSSFAAKVGAPAPDFKGMASNGKTYDLKALLKEQPGKFIVLEWHNQSCPFVKKFYSSGTMQRLQKEWTDKGVIWLSVLSSAPGKQGNLDAKTENDYMKTKRAVPTAALLDSSGAIGKAYNAKTTPHMFVIDPKGTLVYDGAIDNKPTTDPADIGASKDYVNYVSAALTEAMAGKPVTVSSSRPYGCSVKY
jgi:peroxiredoxin